MSYITISLPAALPAAGVAAAVGSSSGGGRGVAPGVGAGVAWGAGVRVAWGGVEGGLSRSHFSLMKPMHARGDPCCTAPGSANSCPDTANLQTVQQSTSYNLDMVVAPNSRRKVRPNPTIGKLLAVLTEDMSPAPAAGTDRWSAGTLHHQRQVTRSKLGRSSETGAGPGPGPGGRSGLAVGIPGLAVTPGRHQFAPKSLGWARVCGTEHSGVWVLKGSARTESLHENSDDVGVLGTQVWL